MSDVARDAAFVVERPVAEEADLMTAVETYLSGMKWPSQQAHERKDGRWGSRNGSKSVSGRLNIGGASREAFVLGKVRKWDDHTRLYDSVHNKKHPLLLRLLRQLMRAHNPSFRFNAIQLNKNVQTKPHYDKKNRGSSYCLGLGTFAGGGLRIFSPGGSQTDVDNRRRWVLYDGKNTLHASVPVRSGVRFAIVYYTYVLGRKRPTPRAASRKRRSTPRPFRGRNRRTPCDRSVSRSTSREPRRLGSPGSVPVASP